MKLSDGIWRQLARLREQAKRLERQQSPAPPQATEAACVVACVIHPTEILTDGCYSEVMEGIFSAWGRILTGYAPALSIEITRECPLRCPGCYAYGDDHLGGDITLREVRDFKGQELIDGVHRARRSASPAARLDRRRRAARALPRAERRCCRCSSKRGIHVQLVTSAVREIPARVARHPDACRSSSRSTACSRSTTCAARRPPTIASSSTSTGTRSPCTAR